MKICERIIERRPREETTIGDEQFWFHARMKVATLGLRQRIEKHQEQQKGLRMVFIYLEMSYDRVPRQKVDMYDGKGSATEVSKDNTGYV